MTDNMTSTSMYGSPANLSIYDIDVSGLSCNNQSYCAMKTTTDTSKNVKKPSVATRVSTTQNTVKKYSYVFDKGRTDKRVSLNVAPLVNNTIDSSFAERVTYVLGQRRWSRNTLVHGFLYGCLNKSCGLIFPYTPVISFTHSVNYEKTDVIHSNVHAVSYKNTPPPTISLDATFTADTRDNALHMLSAIWFLRATTKCDFGEHSGDNNQPGMPPPVLYLNGYNQVMDNIPVVIEQFSYSLPEDKDYVALGINLNGPEYKFAYQRMNENETQSGDMMLNGIKYALKNITGDTTTILSNGNPNGQYYFNNWLPTELKIHLQMTIVPNLMKYKKQFDLNLYKMGIYNLKNQKGELIIPTSSGNVDTLCNTKNEIASFLKEQFKKADNSLAYLAGDTYTSIPTVNESKTFINSNNVTILSDMTKSIFNNERDKNKEYYQSMTNNLSEYFNNGDISPKTYKFDKSGWTW